MTMTGGTRRPASTRPTDGISDDAVAKRTGKRWGEWYALLDGDGAAAMSHREIARHLAERHALSPWWSQMVTVAYERARGRRQVHEKAGGFSASVSRTVPFAARAVYEAWADETRRRRWLDEPRLTLRTATPPRSLRLGWGDDGSVVVVSFTARSAAKCQLVVQHDRLPDAAAVARMKAYWAAAIARLEV